MYVYTGCHFGIPLSCQISRSPCSNNEHEPRYIMYYTFQCDFQNASFRWNAPFSKKRPYTNQIVSRTDWNGGSFDSVAINPPFPVPCTAWLFCLADCCSPSSASRTRLERIVVLPSIGEFVDSNFELFFKRSIFQIICSYYFLNTTIPFLNL